MLTWEQNLYAYSR